MRSVQIERSTQLQSSGRVDATCLDPAITAAASLALSSIPNFPPPPSCPASLPAGSVDRGSRAHLSRTWAGFAPQALSHCLANSAALTPKMPTRYYQDSDSCGRHHSRRSPRFTHPHVLDVPPPTTRTARSPLYQPLSVTSYFQTSPSPSQLVAVPRRIEFVILRTASSPPVASHPASLRRSYLQLRGLGLPRHGLPPCCVGALAGALGAASAAIFCGAPLKGSPTSRLPQGAPGSLPITEGSVGGDGDLTPRACPHELSGLDWPVRPATRSL